jgi:hypothetical protein
MLETLATVVYFFNEIVVYVEYVISEEGAEKR